MVWLGAIFGRFKGWLIAAGVVIAAIGISFLRGRAEGMKIIAAEQDRRRLEAARNRKELDDEVDQMGAGDIDREFERWMRDDER